MTRDLRGHQEIEGEESDPILYFMLKDFDNKYMLPGTQCEVIKPLERTVENLSITTLILNRLGGFG